MSNERQEYLIQRILSGILIFYYKNQEYILKNPSPRIKYKGCLLYDKILQDEKYSSWIRESEMTNVMIRLGLWDASSDKMITTLQKNIEDNKLKLYESIKRPDTFKSNKKLLETNNKRLSYLLQQKNSFRNNTLEGYAESIKGEYIISQTLYSKGRKMFGKEGVSNYKDCSYNFFNSVVNEIYKHQISLTEVRALARSDLWRSFWAASKDNIFPGAVSEWTDDQRSLVNFSRMYDGVYEHPESPEDRVIEDDDVLDGWFIFQKRKRDREKNQSKTNHIRNNTRDKFDKSQEIFLFPNEDQTKEEIEDLNDPISKLKLKQKLGYLKNNKDKVVEEYELPDVRTDLMNQRAEMKRMHKK